MSPTLSPVRFSKQDSEKQVIDTKTYGEADDVSPNNVDYRRLWKDKLNQLQQEFQKRHPQRRTTDPDVYFEKHYFELDTLVDDM